MTSSTSRKTNEASVDLRDIGTAAGELWRYLNTNGVATADAIKRKMKLPSEVLYAAVGWLAREDKLEIQVDGKRVQLSLK
jgi:hypothetical protein